VSELSSVVAKKTIPIAVCVVLLCFVTWAALAISGLSQERLSASRIEFDRENLKQFFPPGSYNNDLIADTYLLDSKAGGNELNRIELLGLSVARLAYIARLDGEMIGAIIPAQADDGFNGTVDLLIAITTYGRITAARVIEDIQSEDLYGIVDIIPSRWMNELAGSSMRELKHLSWQIIESEGEYDQFVGASLTPRAVANRIYDTVVFFQSNRIALLRSGGDI